MLEERRPGISHLCVSELFRNLRELFGFEFNMYKNFLLLLLLKSDWWGVWREKGTFGFTSLQRSPPCPSLAFHEVQDRNWQPGVFAQKAVSTQALALSRAGSWNQGIWRQVSQGARLSCLHMCLLWSLPWLHSQLAWHPWDVADFWHWQTSN